MHRRASTGAQEEGYNKSIDVWSIGCVAAILLTNRMVFDADHEQYADCDRAALHRHFDVAVMDTGEEWLGIGRKARSFVKACLAVDESLRPSASQALCHNWFSNRHYSTEIESAYARAIDGWKAPHKEGEMIQVVGERTTAVSLSSRSHDHHALGSNKEISRHFQGSGNSGTLFSALPKDRAVKRAFGAGPTLLDGDEWRAANSPTNLSNPGSRGGLDASPIESTADSLRSTTKRRRLSIYDFAPPWTQTQLTGSPVQPSSSVGSIGKLRSLAREYAPQLKPTGQCEPGVTRKPAQISPGDPLHGSVSALTHLPSPRLGWKAHQRPYR